MSAASTTPAAVDPFATPPPAATPATPPATTPSADPFSSPTGTDVFSTAPAAEPAGLSSQDWAIGLGVVLVAAAVFFLIRGAVQTQLAKQHAAPDAAIGASWTLFAFLTVVTAFVVFGLLGDLWSATLFLVSALVLGVVLLLLTVFMFMSALGRRR